MSDPVGSSSSSGSVSRRRVLLGGAAGVAALGASSALGSLPVWASDPIRQQVPTGPFSLGVASGDPLPDGVVLWTRLAPNPLAEDGRGGMPDRPVPVQWQVAEDEHFRRVVAAGSELTLPEEAHSAHVELTGLRPGAEYFYRFRTESDLSPVGRTKTAPAVNSRLDRFAFAFASCQNYPSGFFNAYAHMAEEDLDLVAFLGDYIYEGGAQGELGRGHYPVGEIRSLSDYRLRHAQYKSDTDLQAAHAAFPWAVVFDDHEVENNWADEISQRDGEPDSDPQVFRQRRARAFQAYYEHMPLRRTQRPNGPDVQIYRRLTFGDLMDFYLLDTRQYRSDQVGDARRTDPSRTILGDEQKSWLRQAVAGPTARWNVLAQQVFFSQRDFVAGPETNFSNDAWDGYFVERNEVRDHLAASGTSNPVVLTGDVHASYVCDVKADFNDPASATVATELVGTSITSGGDGQDQRSGDPVQLQENPHIKFINRKRGYVRNIVTPTEWTADFRIVDYVTRTGAPIRNRATFVIENGRPGAQPA
ncbi:alkaline phosphatase D [Amycolatopsis marina]|uniref:Alkaline phosphatase D n=1 Tax=Amycolatopsis marina TaxID=490629 RepID=A0A1I1BW98_9PSEU|nr:alkaline phosphatase D family protein [Amycolatopsis marina]SFB52928.1 alkaline phosphatase D [Amycolatopsis marina]